MGQYFARVAREFTEQVVLGGGQVNLNAAGTNLAVGIIDQQAVFAAAAIV